MHPHVLYHCGSITLGWDSNKIEFFLQVDEIHSACPIWRCIIQKCLWKLARHVLGHLDFKWSAITGDDKNSQRKIKQKRQLLPIT